MDGEAADRGTRIADVLEAPEREKKRDHEDGCVASSTAGGAFQTKDEGDVGSRGCWCEPAQPGRSCSLRPLGETGRRPAARS